MSSDLHKEALVQTFMASFDAELDNKAKGIDTRKKKSGAKSNDEPPVASASTPCDTDGDLAHNSDAPAHTSPSHTGKAQTQTASGTKRNERSSTSCT